MQDRLRGRLLFISVHGDPLAPLGGIQAGGQNVYVRELTQALACNRWAVDVFTHWDNPDAPETESYGEHLRVVRLAAGQPGFIPKGRLFSCLPKFLTELNNWIKKHNLVYHLVHSNYWLSGWVGRQLKRMMGLPHIHTPHSLGLVRVQSLNLPDHPQLAARLVEERNQFQVANVVLAATATEKQTLETGYGLPTTKIEVIPAGVDPKRFNPGDRTAARADLLLGQQKMIFFAGRFETNKGLDVLIRALHTLEQSYPATAQHVTLWVAGGDPLDVPEERWSADKRRLVELVRELGLADQVRFLGPVSQDQLPLYYRAADVCVVPSFYESFGLVAVEAMGCGCPVIASRVGGLKHTVRHGETGLTIAPKNPAELAAALATLLDDPPLRQKLSQRAAEWVQNQFTWHKAAAAVQKVYRKVLGIS